MLARDFIESFTGLNHKSTWHELEEKGHGTNVIILAYNIIRRFLTSLDNVAGVYIVSGNHDRVTMKMEGDPYGSVAGLLAFMLQENTPLDIRHNAVLLGVEIDSIYYILTHNHLGVSKGDLGRLLGAWAAGRIQCHARRPLALTERKAGLYHYRRETSRSSKLSAASSCSFVYG